MTTTALTLFDRAPMPAHVAELNKTSNIVARDTTNQLSFRGKIWRVIVDGVENIAKNNEGDPLQSVQVVILDYNKMRSRAYYTGGYEEGKSQPPVCWSKDGKAPDPSVQEKQHVTCDGCQQAAKGSKVTDNNKAVMACSTFKRAVVVPSVDTAFTPLLLKIPQTSMWDRDNKENEVKGFFAFDQYMDELKRRGVENTAAVITKMKFDPRVAYPKLLFGAHSWLPESETANVANQLADRAKLAEILNVSEAAVSSPDTAAAPAAPDEYEAPAPAKAPPAPAAPVAAAAPPPPPAAKPAPKPRPVVVAKPVAPPPPAEDPDDVMVIPGVVVASSSEPAPAAVVAAPATEGTDKRGLKALLTSWDDD